MLSRHAWLVLFCVAALIAPLGGAASAEGAHKATKSRAHRKATARASKQKKFPARKRSAFGGKGSAPIAFFVCRDPSDIGIMGKTPDIAQRNCEQAHKAGSTKDVCRCTGRNAVAVYGPYKYPKPKKDEWYSNADYPYEATNGWQFSRDGYVPTP